MAFIAVVAIGIVAIRLFDDILLNNVEIRFYGVFVDGEQKPLNNVSVKCRIHSHRLSSLIPILWTAGRNGVRDVAGTTNEKGEFSIEGYNGFSIDVTGSLDGYHWREGQEWAYYYSDDGGRRAYTPDPKKPVRFVLQHGPGRKPRSTVK